MAAEPGPSFFKRLNSNGWSPQFHWQLAPPQAAQAINLPHEDYPRRVPATIRVISAVMAEAERSKKGPRLSSGLVCRVQAAIFPDHGRAAGRWREHNVTVGNARPPHWREVPTLMQELERRYGPLPLTLATLRHWYLDLELIHPFIDGNGRTGGTILAALSHPLAGRHLTPSQ